MQSDYNEPVNLGPNEGITIDELVDKISLIAGKNLEKKYIKGPIGEQTRHANTDLAQKVLNWKPKRDINEGLVKTYFWIAEMISKNEHDHS